MLTLILMLCYAFMYGKSQSIRNFWSKYSRDLTRGIPIVRRINLWRKSLLVSFDTDRIKEYVFATGKLKEIRGASSILDELNRLDMVEKAEKFNAEKIYANGGSGMFIVPEASAKKLIRAVENEYRLQTRTCSITSASVELPNDFTNQNDVQPYLQTLAYRLRLKKDENALHQPIVTHPFLRTCDSCGEQYATQSVTEAETELLCVSCENKRDKNNKIQEDIQAVITGEAEEYLQHKLWHRVLLDIAREGYPMTRKSRPEDFNDLGNMSEPKNYMGLIYADGDNMGKALEQLDNLDEVKRFSEVVDDAIYQVVHEAVLEYLKPKDSDEYFPFDVLMLGGDDLVMVTTAHKVVEVSMKITKRFSELTEECLGKRLTISAGVAIAHANFPFSSLLTLAEQALKFSKKEAVKRKRRGQGSTHDGLINFIAVSNSNSLDFDHYHRETLSDEDQDIYRTLRPYNLTDLCCVIKTIRKLKKENFPRGKLKELREAVFQSRNQSILEGLKFISGINPRSAEGKKHRQMFWDFLTHFADSSPSTLPFPWFKSEDNSYTPFLDLIELYDFIETQNEVE